MGNDNNSKGNKGQSQNGYSIYDNNNTLEYNGAWLYDTFTLPDNPQIQTYHTTADTNASVFVPFYVPSNDFVLQVLGIIPPGDGKISANYTIDDGEPTTVTVPTITQDTPEYYQQYYASPALEEGLHNLTIKVLDTGKGRNYSIDLVKVVSDGIGEGNKPQPEPESEGGHQGSKTAAVVGAVLSSVIFLLVFLVAFFVWRKRRLSLMRKSGEQHLPPMMYYARSTSNETQKGMYMVDQEASVIDTNSRFTLRKDVQDDSHRTWVTFSPPPSEPDSALVTDRPISSWSSYKDSSVIAHQSHPNVSRFSPFTPMTVSSMAFAERALTPASSRRAGPTLRIGIPVQQRPPRQLYDIRRF